VPTLVLLGCCRLSGVTSAAFLCFGQYVATVMPCSCVVQQYVSDVSNVSESEGNAPVTEESSDDWEEASDQTEADEEEAEEAIEELYGPFRYAEM
jgi:hypothetical protein